MSDVFHYAGVVSNFIKNRDKAQSDEDWLAIEQWTAALDRARVDLHHAIEALPGDERDKLVAMYETLRHWAYGRRS